MPASWNSTSIPSCRFRAVSNLLSTGWAGRDCSGWLGLFSRVPAETLEALLASEDLYRIKACPLSVEERKELLDDQIPWTVFTTIARKVAVAGADLERVEEELADLAGFRPLKEALERHFFQRAAYLRCFRIVNEGRAILSRIRLHELPKLKMRDREEQAQRERFLAFIRQAGGDRTVAHELEEFVTRVCGAARRGERLEVDLRQWSGGSTSSFTISKSTTPTSRSFNFSINTPIFSPQRNATNCAAVRAVRL